MRDEAILDKYFEVADRGRSGIKAITRFVLLRNAPSGGGKQSD
jgi:hypothetical protein